MDASIANQSKAETGRGLTYRGETSYSVNSVGIVFSMCSPNGEKSFSTRLIPTR